MHDHNNNSDDSGGKGMKVMMWMMMICCAGPILLTLFLGVGGRAAGVSSWVILGAMAIMMFAHFFMMRRSSGHSCEKSGEQEKTDKKNVNKKL
ncbi:MAG: hypothetical protein WC788_09860 [Candidatus Paceibacterota bacterium]|jgi:uncharacterized membrane protein